jgi:hypothetical protein
MNLNDIQGRIRRLDQLRSGFAAEVVRVVSDREPPMGPSRSPCRRRAVRMGTALQGGRAGLFGRAAKMLGCGVEGPTQAVRTGIAAR